jgi:hypothetical protein
MTHGTLVRVAGEGEGVGGMLSGRKLGARRSVRGLQPAEGRRVFLFARAFWCDSLRSRGKRTRRAICNSLDCASRWRVNHRLLWAGRRNHV